MMINILYGDFDIRRTAALVWRASALAGAAIFATAVMAGNSSGGNSSNNPQGDSPKLSDDGGGIINVLPSTGDSTKRVAARPGIPVQTYDTYYGCNLLNDNKKSYRVPIATRWWFSGPAKGDVSYCVKTGLGGATNALGSVVTNVQLTRINGPGSYSSVPSSTPSAALGGNLVISTLWPNKNWDMDMVATKELCNATSVKQADLASVRLKLANLTETAGGTCLVPFGPNPRPPVAVTKLPDLKQRPE